MGNSSSSESPRRTPQRLSKPRIGNLPATPSPLPDPGSPIAASSPRYSNSYLVGASPLPSPQSEVRVKPASLFIPEAIADDPAEDDERRDSIPRLELSRIPSRHSKKDSLERRKSTGLVATKVLETATMSRRHSSIQPLTRSSTMGSSPNRKSARFDRSAYEVCRLRQGDFSKDQESSIGQLERAIDSQEPSETQSLHTHQDENVPLSRVQSETDLFAPMRRRSALLIPGLATRPVPPPPTKASFRKSLPATPEELLYDPMDMELKRRQTMTPHVLAAQLPDRAGTPTSVAEYQQIGGMKFGSLRITNGQPDSSPRSSLEPRRVAPKSTISRGSVLSRTSITDGEELENYCEDGPTFTEPEFQMPQFSPDELVINYERFLDPSPNGSTSDVSPMTKLAAPKNVFELHGDDEVLIESKAHQDPTDLREDASAKSTETASESESAPVSISSSESSKEALSNPDSGYGSSASLQSFFSLKKKAQGPEEATGHRPFLKHHLPFRIHLLNSTDRMAVVSTEEPPSSPSKSESSSISLEHKAEVLERQAAPFEVQQLEEPKHIKSGVISGHSRSISLGLNANTVKDVSSTSIERKPSKLKKFLKVSRRKSLPSVYTSASLDSSTPPVPTNAEELAEKHHGKVAVPTRAVTLRPKSSKEMLVHMATTEIIEQRQPVLDHQDEKRTRSDSLVDREGRRHSYLSSILPTRSPSRHRTLRKSQSTAKPVMDDSHDDEQIWDYEAAQVAGITNMRHGVGNSAFDQAILSAHDMHGPYAPAYAERPRYQVTANAQLHHPRLRPRSSAPDFLETVPEPCSTPDILALKKPKTPPPVSLRTRGSKSKRPRRRSTQPQPRTYSSNESPPAIWSNGAEHNTNLPNLSGAVHTGQTLHRPHRYDGFRPAHQRPLFITTEINSDSRGPPFHEHRPGAKPREHRRNHSTGATQKGEFTATRYRAFEDPRVYNA